METLPKNLNENIFYTQNSKKSSSKKEKPKNEEKESSHYSFVNMMSNGFNSNRNSINHDDKRMSYKSDDVVVNL